MIYQVLNLSLFLIAFRASWWVYALLLLLAATLAANIIVSRRRKIQQVRRRLERRVLRRTEQLLRQKEKAEQANREFETARRELEERVQASTSTLQKAHEQLNNELREREKAEAALAALGMLTDGIAHDFNNFLTAVLLNIATAKMDLKESDDPFKLLTEAQDACVQAKNLTQQLITFAKGGDSARKTVDIRNLIQDTVNFTLRESNVKADFDISPELKPVKVDEVQLSQVINNIALNAIQAMPNGGRLTVCADNLTDKDATRVPLSSGEYVHLRLSDDGVGIPEKDLAKIFDPSFKTKSKSSGLGLSISYTIIKNHHGLITMDSQVDVGTEVSVYLPAAGHPVVGEEPAPATGQLKTGSGRVLVMDDEVIIRQSLAVMLGRLGYDVALAKDGAEAQCVYRTAREQGEPFDVVILDLTIPGGPGGLDTMTSLRDFDNGVKAILTSGYLTDPLLSEYGKYGFAEVLKKPFDLAEVSLKIHNVMTGA